jgi:phosphoribosylaminoimidazole-succinocarboxamide synthase
MTSAALSESHLPLKRLNQGKVREIYAVDDATLLLVASDRVSAFDVVLPEPIPSKGAVLTQMSAYWFQALARIVPNHCVTAETRTIVRRVPALSEYEDTVRGRAMLVRRAHPIPFECVVRGYLAGSGWAEYRERGTLAGEALPGGLVESARLDPPLFTPATKALSGHDENITVARLREELGTELADRLRDVSLALYSAAREQAAKRGIIIADTKFEFGHDATGKLLLIDELLTPDSSRFWPADRYQPGKSQPSFDKQPLRDYLSGLKRAGQWNGNAPGPHLPVEIVQATAVRYQDAFQRITGAPLRTDP